MILLPLFFENRKEQLVFFLIFCILKREVVAIPIFCSALLKTTHNQIIRYFLSPSYQHINRQKFTTELLCFKQLKTFNKPVLFHRFSRYIFLQTLKYSYSYPNRCKISLNHNEGKEFFYVTQGKRIDEKRQKPLE